MADDPSVWEQWQALLSAENPDLLKILKLGAQLQAYFATVERETLKVARATGGHLGSVGRSTRDESAGCVATSHVVSRNDPQAAVGPSLVPRRGPL